MSEATPTLKRFIETGAETGTQPQPVDRSARPDTIELVDTTPTAASFLVAQPADTTAALPDGVALLCVSQSSRGPGHFTMSWHHGPRPLEAHNRQIPVESDGASQSIAQIMYAAAKHRASDPAPPPSGAFEGPWHAAYLRTTDCWHGVEELGTWVKHLRATAANNAQLVIWDATGEDIPWELYFGELGVDEHGDVELGWLGVTLPVSRWIGGDPRPESCPASKHEAAGGLLVFDDGKTHGCDVEYQRTYDAFAHMRVGELEDSIERLMDRLEGDEEFGLLLIRGHGEYGDSAETFTLAGLPLIKLNELRMVALARNHPAIVLGVCSSARTFVQRNAMNRPVRGFVEPFIRRGASSVTAVLADIDVLHLHGMVARLLQEAATDPIMIAEWLRKHRATYYSRLKQETHTGNKEEQHRMFLTSCLFVCYCHPHTTLQLCAAETAP